MTVQHAFKTARMLLNDINGITWSDHLLIPLMQQAHTELVQELELNSHGVVTYETIPIYVPANTQTMPNLPANIVNPESMMERVPRTSRDSFVDMMRVTYIPQVNPEMQLHFWAWMQDEIRFVGATQDREVILRYKGLIVTPEVLTDPLGCIHAETYIGPRIAALAKDIAGVDSEKTTEMAEKALYKLVQSHVHKNQRPVRNRAYRAPKPLWEFTGNVTIPIGGCGCGPIYIKSETVPNSETIDFEFPYYPKQVVWNGISQFEGVGYTLSVANGKYVVRFRDILGQPLVPGFGDDIREQIS